MDSSAAKYLLVSLFIALGAVSAHAQDKRPIDFKPEAYYRRSGALIDRDPNSPANKEKSNPKSDYLADVETEKKFIESKQGRLPASRK